MRFRQAIRTTLFLGTFAALLALLPPRPAWRFDRFSDADATWMPTRMSPTGDWAVYEPLETASNNDYRAKLVARDGDSKALATTVSTAFSADGAVAAWRKSGGTKVLELRAGSAPATLPRLRPLGFRAADGMLVGVSFEKEQARIETWDWRQQRLVARLPLADPPPGHEWWHIGERWLFSQDGERLATDCRHAENPNHGFAYAIDTRTGQRVLEVPLSFEEDNCCSIEHRRGSTRLVVEDSEGIPYRAAAASPNVPRDEPTDASDRYFSGWRLREDPATGDDCLTLLGDTATTPLRVGIDNHAAKLGGDGEAPTMVAERLRRPLPAFVLDWLCRLGWKAVHESIWSWELYAPDRVRSLGVVAVWEPWEDRSSFKAQVLLKNRLALGFRNAEFRFVRWEVYQFPLSRRYRDAALGAVLVTGIWFGIAWLWRRCRQPQTMANSLSAKKAGS